MASTDVPTSGEMREAEPAPAESEPGFFASLFKPLIQSFDSPESSSFQHGPGDGVSETKDDWAESIFGDNMPELVSKTT